MQAVVLFSRPLRAPRILLGLVFIIGLCGCAGIDVDRPTSDETEAIALAILTHDYRETEIGHEAAHVKSRREARPDDPFLLGGLPQRTEIEYQKCCVRILGADPQPDFFDSLPRYRHLLQPGSTFQKHPRVFSSTEERVAYLLDSMPSLLSVTAIKFSTKGTKARAEVDFYNHEIDFSSWVYVLEKRNGRWRVTYKHMTSIG